MATVKFRTEIFEGRRGVRGPMRFPSVLIKFGRRIADWREFWVTVFIPRYLEKVQQNFQTQGELSGRRAGWPDLSPRYAAWKSRHFPGRLILERTRRLRTSLGLSGVGGSDSVLQVRPTSLRLGTRVPYARYHTFERPFMVPIVQREWRPIIDAWVASRARNAGMK